ncbi:MAG: hypothetical protein IJG32_02980, partial [Selenomonadaceae bacterium]|nr:hypothetical protein [Selenomonadaceae bacterium]
KMVDDGVVNTVEGENSLHSRLEQMGVEIIPFDESKVAQGDIIFYDGKQTYQHVLVADHKDADGNWRVFGNSSSANKVMEQPLYQGQTPAWIAKVSNLQGANVQTQQTRQKETQEAEPTKPLFDLNSEDSTTQKLLEQFANERFESAIKNEDGETADFFNAMFDDDSKFQDTPENRQAITTRYGDELDAFVQKNSQTPPQQKPPETKGKAKQENPYDRNTALIQTGRKYLDELLKKGDEPSRKTAWTLNSAIQNNDLAKVENILKQNNVAIPEQPQPVEENEPPENILSPKSSPNDKKIKVASAQVKTGNKGKKSRQKQGQALIDLAAQHGIEIPNPEVIALKQGSTKAVQKWRDNLMQAGVFNAATQQSPQSQATSVSGETKFRKLADGTIVFTPPNYQPPQPSLKERAKPLIKRFKAQQNLEREADLTNEDDDESRFVFPNDNSAELESRNEREDEHLLELEGEYWRLGEEERRLDRLREEGRRQRDLEIARLKSANRNAKITAGKEILRTLRSPKYSEVKAKVEATSGLAKALENGSVEAIRQVRNFIAEVDNKALQESQARQAQARTAQEQRIAQIRANRRRSGAQTAQADEQARQAQEQYRLRQAAQSRQAGEQAQLGLGQAQAQSQAQESQPIRGKMRRGNTVEVITGNRKPHQVQYRVVEGEELNPSHEIDNGSVFANKNYPAELQPRDRTRADMQAQLISMSNNLKPADLLDARDVNQGAPVIRNDGVVLNGNGRTAAIRYAYKNGKADAYKAALVENAQRFGLDADEISRMKNPVLVREFKNDLTPEDVQDITTTQTGGAKMGSSEQAQSDAAKLSAATLDYYPQDENVDLTHSKANDFLRAAIKDIATPDERNALTQHDGSINQDGINRVKRALFALAYGDEGLIARMSESTDDNVRGATNALLNAAPTIAKVQAGMKNGTLHKYDLNSISDAVKKISALRNEGKPVQKYLQEQSLFDEDSAEMKEILSFLDKNKRAPNKIAAFLKKIASNIQGQGDPRQGNLFGEKKPAPLIDLIKRARADVENGGQADLFAQEQKTSEQETSKPESPQKKSTSTKTQSEKADLEAKVAQISDEEARK